MSYFKYVNPIVPPPQDLIRQNNIITLKKSEIYFFFTKKLHPLAHRPIIMEEPTYLKLAELRRRWIN